MATQGDLAATAENWLRDNHTDKIPYGTGAGELVCNQFVVACIRAALDPSFPNYTADHFGDSPHFMKVNDAKRGDLVHFPGHIAIVTDPDHGVFWGAQGSKAGDIGVSPASYKGASYWNGDYHGKVHDYFLRWVP
jgi:cell wall-associated NlpC family hydrolase